jgi:hypothetical protein
MFPKRIAVILCAVSVLIAARALADLSGSYAVPLDDPAIQYATRPVSDPVSALQQRIERGEVKLQYSADFGYLPAILRNLQAPVSSQVLVFSKTSFQAARIYPRTPRALYFNDRVAVGWVRGGDVVEIASVDPRQGVVFYTLDQGESASPQIVRRDDCLQCHHNGSTLGVPGFLVRSVYPDMTGMPLFHLGTYITDHRSPIKERWGGWYVSGTHGKQTHLGNLTYDKDGNPRQDSLKNDNVATLVRYLDTGAYLSPHSDIVALMVLEHQTRMQNLITRVSYETRMALASQTALNEALKRTATEVSDSTVRRINGPADELAAYMLFAGETRLESKIAGTSTFAADFARQGPRDHRGRSLRQFDLTRRMFQYPCSYLIYSEAFDNLPEQARQRVYQRLWEVLTGRDQSPAFAHLSTEDRQAILEILTDTKRGLPEYWGSR